MRRLVPIALVATFAFPLLSSSQTLEKELVASITGPAIERGVVSEILWDGGTLLIQSAVLEHDGQLSPRYFTLPGPRMEVKRLASAPPGEERYWQMKASRVSPTGLGRIKHATPRCRCSASARKNAGCWMPSTWAAPKRPTSCGSAS